MTRLASWAPIVALPLVLLQSAPATTQSDTAAQLHESQAQGHQHTARRCTNTNSRDLLFDDFDGPTLNPIWQPSLPDAPYRFESVPAKYLVPMTVFIGDCNTQVPNPVLPSGCAVSDLFAECSDNAGDRNHHQAGKSVRCVARLSNDLKQDGVITRGQSKAINACAIRAKFE